MKWEDVSFFIFLNYIDENSVAIVGIGKDEKIHLYKMDAGLPYCFYEIMSFEAFSLYKISVIDRKATMIVFTDGLTYGEPKATQEIIVVDLDSGEVLFRNKL